MTRQWRIAILIISIIFLVLLSSCGKKKPTEPDDGTQPIVTDETVVLQPATTQTIIEVTENQIILPSQTDSSIYQTGNVLASAPSVAAPYGLLRKVVSHSTQGNQVVVNTAPARLEDAFEQLDLNITQSMKTSDIESSLALSPGVVFQPDTRNPYSFNYQIDEDYNLGNNVILNVNGELNLTLGYELIAQISLTQGLHYIKAGSFITSNGELELNVNGSFDYERNIELYQHTFTPFTFMIGAVPIVVVPKAIIVLTIDANGQASVTTSVTASASLSAGVIYQKPNWSTYQQRTLNFNYNPPVLSAAMDATVSAGPRFEINLYGIAGPFAYGRAWMNMNANLASTPWWTLRGGYFVDAGVRFNALGYVADYTAENIISHSAILAQATQNQVATPTFNPAGGTYSSAQNVTLSCTTSGAVIRYTTNGNEPTETSTQYSSPIAVSVTTTIKAKAFKSGWTPSSTANATYTISTTQPVATPSFNPAGGTYSTTQSVSISTTTPNATIRYTTNGSEPTSSSTIYSSPISVSSTTTIKAKGFLDGWTPSATASATYTITPSGTVATPTFNPPGGTYSTTQSVSISTTTPNATIRYTTNGSEPTSSSTIYSSPISVSSTTTIKAKGFLDGWTPSATASATYTIGTTPPPADFVFVQGGTFHNGTSNVTLSSFYIDKYEVTQASYQAVMGTNPSTFAGNPNRPVERVSWFNAIEYCNRRSIQEGLTPAYSYGTHGSNPDNWPSGWNTSSSNHTNVSCNWSANGYRLPTEMEWMFAAKGGNQSQGYTYSGSNTIGNVAWYSSNSSSRTWDVGLKDPNELGTFDMSGNVWEWVWDIWNSSYPTGNQTNPTGPVSGSHRVARGGSWNHYADDCTVSYRYNVSATGSSGIIGFRCVRVIP